MAEGMTGLPKDLMAARALHPEALVTCDGCGRTYTVHIQTSDSVVFGLPLFGCECGVTRDVLVAEAIEHLREELALMRRDECDEEPYLDPSGESSSYRSQMIDAGRGRLLR